MKRLIFLLSAVLLTSCACGQASDKLDSLRAEKAGQSKAVRIASRSLESYLKVWADEVAQEMASRTGKPTTLSVEEYVFLDDLRVGVVKVWVADEDGRISVYGVFIRDEDYGWGFRDLVFGQFIPSEQ